MTLNGHTDWVTAVVASRHRQAAAHSRCSSKLVRRRRPRSRVPRSIGPALGRPRRRRRRRRQAVGVRLAAARTPHAVTALCLCRGGAAARRRSPPPTLPAPFGCGAPPATAPAREPSVCRSRGFASASAAADGDILLADRNGETALLAAAHATPPPAALLPPAPTATAAEAARVRRRPATWGEALAVAAGGGAAGGASVRLWQWQRFERRGRRRRSATAAAALWTRRYRFPSTARPTSGVCSRSGPTGASPPPPAPAPARTQCCCGVWRAAPLPPLRTPCGVGCLGACGQLVCGGAGKQSRCGTWRRRRRWWALAHRTATLEPAVDAVGAERACRRSKRRDRCLRSATAATVHIWDPRGPQQLARTIGGGGGGFGRGAASGGSAVTCLAATRDTLRSAAPTVACSLGTCAPPGAPLAAIPRRRRRRAGARLRIARRASPPPPPTARCRCGAPPRGRRARASVSRGFRPAAAPAASPPSRRPSPRCCLAAAPAARWRRGASARCATRRRPRRRGASGRGIWTWSCIDR